MNWVKKNTFLSGLIAVVIVVGGILGFLLFSAYSNYQAISSEYDAQVAKLQQLQNRTPFPSQENIKRYAELAQAYKQEYQGLLDQVSKMQLPVEAISPQAFQDRLRSVVSEVQAAAKTAGVQLGSAESPDGFYMGFDQYRGQLPSDTAAGPLARQLTAIQYVVDALVENRVKSIDAITRKPLPEEAGPAPEPANPRDRVSQRGPQEKTDAVISAFPFEITFTAEQGRLRQSLNAIVRGSQFFIIRYLTVVNSATSGPERIVAEPLPVDPNLAATPNPDGTAPAPGTGATTPPPEQPAMNVIVGRETLTVAARIEMITFNTPTAKN